jgi:hypothetical protein
MSRLQGFLDPETRAYFEAIEAAVRPGRHQPDSANEEPDARDTRTPAQRCHDAFKLAMETAVAAGRLGQHRGHPVTVVVTTTLSEINQAAHAAADLSLPMPTPARTGGGSRLPMRDLIRMAAKAIHYLAVFDDHTERPLYLGRQKRVATADQRLICYARDRGCTRPIASHRAITARSTIRRTGRRVAGPMLTSYFSPAVATMVRRAGANGAPRSPRVADLAGPTAVDRQRSTTLTTPMNSCAEIPTHPTTKVEGRRRDSESRVVQLQALSL